MQAHFLGMPVALKTRLTSDAEVLQKYMLRHTKTQKINGSSALVLPKSTTTVTLIEMSASERMKYNSNRNNMMHQLREIKRKRELKFFHATNRVFYGLLGPLRGPGSSKIKALEKCLLSALGRDPNMRAVVFTQFLDQIQLIQELVTNLRRGIQFYSFSGSTR